MPNIKVHTDMLPNNFILFFNSDILLFSPPKPNSNKKSALIFSLCKVTNNDSKNDITDKISITVIVNAIQQLEPDKLINWTNDPSSNIPLNDSFNISLSLLMVESNHASNNFSFLLIVFQPKNIFDSFL